MDTGLQQLPKNMESDKIMRKKTKGIGMIMNILNITNKAAKNSGRKPWKDNPANKYNIADNLDSDKIMKKKTEGIRMIMKRLNITNNAIKISFETNSIC
ncbi:hypothetical protein JTB14_006074 [Gonioctena quinquepunctata]|nr:hypothetical protein JTB14_006074 [Gonioctena quinquepunctata]